MGGTQLDGRCSAKLVVVEWFESKLYQLQDSVLSSKPCSLGASSCHVGTRMCPHFDF